MTIRQWEQRLAADRRVVALSEARRDGELWVVVYAGNWWAAGRLLKALRQSGCGSAARRGWDSLWLEKQEGEHP